MRVQLHGGVMMRETSEPRTGGGRGGRGRPLEGLVAALASIAAASCSRDRAPYGRVEAMRRGNVVLLATRGVSELTLLISPDAFDLSQPITVNANGRIVAEKRVEPSLATLMKWAARDHDRTMLFGAEVHVALK